MVLVLGLGAALGVSLLHKSETPDPALTPPVTAQPSTPPRVDDRPLGMVAPEPAHVTPPARPVPQFYAATREAIFACGAGFPGRIWADAKPVWVENVAEDDRCPRASIAAKEGLHAAFGFPITIQHEVVGVIEFFSHEIQPPDEDLLRMMATIGSQLGQFIVRKQMEESLAEERNGP